MPLLSTNTVGLYARDAVVPTNNPN